MNDIAVAAIAALGSSGFCSVVLYILQRKDKIQEQLKKISEDIASMRDGMAQNNAINARTHILRFDDEVVNGTKHSREYWRQLLDDIDTYEEYCENHKDFKNSYTVAANKHLKDTYQGLIDSGEFKM